MASPLRKKPKLEDSSDDGTEEKIFDSVHMFILPTGIGPKRLEIMRKSAVKNGFKVHLKFEYIILAFSYFQFLQPPSLARM